jgi:hypothetical protein
MTVESPPFATAVGSYSAEQTRRAMFAWAARTAANAPGILAGGLLSASDLQISAPSSGMSVNVSTGEAVIGGTEGGTQGGYYARNASTTNLTIATANASNPRIDTIVALVSDAGYGEPAGGSGSQWALVVVTGTAVAGATLANLSGAAAVPASSLLIGYVLVPAAATSIVTADIANVASVVVSQSSLAKTVCRVYRAGAYTMGAGGANLYPDTIDFDLGGNYNIGATSYTCPSAGIYSVDSSMATNTVQDPALMLLYKNGASVRQGPYSSSYGCALTDSIKCNAGDTLAIYCSISTSSGVQTGANVSYVNFARIA